MAALETPTLHNLHNATTSGDLLNILTASQLPVHAITGQHTPTGYHLDGCAHHPDTGDVIVGDITQLAPCCTTRPFSDLADNLSLTPETLHRPDTDIVGHAVDILYVAHLALTLHDPADILTAATIYSYRAHCVTGRLHWLVGLLDEHCRTLLSRHPGGDVNTLLGMDRGIAYQLRSVVARDVRTQALWARTLLRHPGFVSVALVDGAGVDALTQPVDIGERARILLTCDNSDELNAATDTLLALADNGNVTSDMVRTVAALHPTTRIGKDIPGSEHETAASGNTH
jgi:hypothetical protein